MNFNNLFQYFNGWMQTKRDKYDHEVFLYRATTAVLCLAQMNRLKEACVEQFKAVKDELLIKDNEIIFWSPTLVYLFKEFSPFVSSIVIIQNIIMKLIGKDLGINGIPNSFSDCIKKLDKYNLPDNICNEARRYWNIAGKEIRNYRDIDQHHHELIDNTLLQIYPIEDILIYLPDNPQEASKRNFTYNEKKNAIPYFEFTFNELHNFVESIAQTLGYKKSGFAQSVRMTHKGKIQQGVKKTISLIISDVKTLNGYDIGQSEDCTIYVHPLIHDSVNK